MESSLDQGTAFFDEDACVKGPMHRCHMHDFYGHPS
jgi:hypothetical protein